MTTLREDRAERKSRQEAAAARIAKAIAEAKQVVATGICPECGTGLRRNLALTGWWQCGAYGRPDFRRVEDRNRPDCNFQTFTE